MSNTKRTLTGTVTCKSAEAQLEPGSVAEVQVVDVSRACGRATVLGEVTINNPDKFPFSFQVEYNDGPIKEMNYGGSFAVGVRIERDGKLDFINDTRFEINKASEKSVLDHIDMFVIKV